MLHEDGLYGLEIAGCNRKNISEMKKDKEISRGDFQCKFCKSIACIKLYDNKSVSLVGSNLEKNYINFHCAKVIKRLSLQN